MLRDPLSDLRMVLQKGLLLIGCHMPPFFPQLMGEARRGRWSGGLSPGGQRAQEGDARDGAEFRSVFHDVVLRG